jgi:peptidyl-prolyl cis-trans isomerase D
MAILGKIRSKGVLLLVVIGLALFAFIIGDALTQGSSYFNKSRETVADIAGEQINIKDYQAAIDQMVDVYKIETGQTELGEEVMSQLRTSVWESLVNEKLLFDQAQKLGLAVSKEELSDYLIGKHIHPLILQRRVFAGENGQFSQSVLIQFLNSLDQTPENEEMRTQIAQAKSYWLFWERNVKIAIMQDKYNTLISKAITANSLDAKLVNSASKATYDVSYIVEPYFMISDSTVKVSDSEIKNLYSKKKEQFKQKANRSANYVVFTVKPSTEDYKKAETAMNKLSNEFRTTQDISGFVNDNSDVRYDGRTYSDKTVPANLKEFAFSGKSGDVAGPIFENDAYTMARIVENGILQSDSVKLRHIYLTKADEGKTDSIINVIKSGGDFAALAAKFSAVQQTAKNGGEIGWLTEGVGFDKEITTKAFASGVNEIFTVSNAQGTQIMQVTGKTTPRRKVKLAIFQINVSPSDNTVSKIYNDAKQFAADLKGDKFSKKAEEKGYAVRTASELLESTENIADIKQSRQVIRWVFENDKNDVSDVFDCDNQYIVATITEVNSEGYKSLEKVLPQLKAELIRDKKAESIIKKITSAAGTDSNIDALAAKLGTEVKTAQAVNFSSYQFGVAGFEPAVIGKVSTLALNKLSTPVKGNAGVYALLATNKTDNPQPMNLQMEIMQLNSRYSYTLPYAIVQDIRDNADIKDNRLRFY